MSRALRRSRATRGMAQVIANALRQRIRPATEPYALSTQGVTVRLEVEAANADPRPRAWSRAVVHGGSPPIRRGDARRDRGPCSRRGSPAAFVVERSTTTDLQRHLANDRIWNNFLSACGRRCLPPQLVHELLTIEQRLRSAGRGHSHRSGDRDAAAPRRADGRRPSVDADDMPLIDEAQALDPGHQGAVRLRHRRRGTGPDADAAADDRSPLEGRDLTLVGDIAQATGPTRYKDWDEISAHLPPSAASAGTS